MKNLFCLLALLLIGCSHTKMIGTIGDKQIWKVQSTSILGPSVNVIAVLEGSNLHFLQPFGGNGLLPGLTGGASLVGAAAIFGHSLRPEQSSVNQSQGSVSEHSVVNATSTATSTATATAPMPMMPPAPGKHHTD